MSWALGDGLLAQSTVCDANIAYFRAAMDRSVLWSNASMILGALMSGTGAVFAAFLSASSQRKAAALIGALGAVISVLPKALPSQEALAARLAAAERHRLLGTKVRNQFQFAEPDESLTSAKKYVSARFTDCASLDPPAAAPDLPLSEQPALTELRQRIGAATPFVPAPGLPEPNAGRGVEKTPAGLTSTTSPSAPATPRVFNPHSLDV